ncbi:hypothetical protein EMIT0111MI5_10199 [Burkholderia sp. IT-111MI5]
MVNDARVPSAMNDRLHGKGMNPELA